VVERASNENEVIVRDLVKKETNLDLFVGLKVELSTGEAGVIEGSFGKSGKIKITITEGLKPDTYTRLAGTGKKKKDAEAAPPVAPSEPVLVRVKFKRYIFDEKKQMIQL